MDEVLSKLLKCRGNLSPSLTYNRLYVCLKAGSHFPSLAIYKNSRSQPATNMQLELLQQNVKPYKISWDEQLKDVYAVTFSPITSTWPPIAIFAAVSAGRRTSEISDLLQKDLDPGGTLGSAEECPTDPHWRCNYITDDRSHSICKFQPYTADVYEVRSKLGPSSAYFALPECFADLVPADAIIVGMARANCWYQAVGEVKINLR
jgi:hypothetical protein